MGTTIAGYVERYFQRSGRTEFPTVRQVAKRFNVRQDVVEQAVEDSHGVHSMQLTYYFVDWEEPLGGWFVETLTEPSPKGQNQIWLIFRSNE